MNAQEIEQGFQEIWKLFAETDKKFQETIKETTEQMKETDRRLDKKFHETSEQIKETDKKVTALTGKWGRFVEGLIAPAVERLFGERGYKVDRVYQRVKAHKNGGGLEIDILAVDGEHAVLLEAKSTLGVDDVREHLERLEKFKLFFPEYADRRVIGAVAGIVIDEGADKFAYKKGLFVIEQSGETVTITNDDEFSPMEW